MNKHKQTIIRVMGLVLALLMALTVLLPVFFANASEARDKVQELQGELDALNKELKDIKDKSVAAEKTRKNINAQIAVIKEQLTSLSTSLEEQQAALTLKQQELDAKVIQMNKEQALLDNRIAALYMTRNQGVLASVLGASDFSQMLTTADSMQRISNADNDLMKTLSKERADIEIRRAELDAAVKKLEEDMALLEQKQQEYATKVSEVNKNISYLEALEDITEEEKAKKFTEYQNAVKEMEKEFGANGGQMGPEFLSGKFVRPVPGHNYVSSGFGMRTLLGRPDYHTGVDIAGGGINGKTIVASAEGVVTVARYGTTGYGVRVYIDHGGGYITRYGHCSALYVKEGDYVAQGMAIAAVGSTGLSTGPHLHFEIRQNGIAINPAPYLGY